MKITNSAINTVNLTDIYIKLKEKYRNVFISQYDDIVFIYRALGRREYRELLQDDRFNNMEKEELICQTCVLWPENFDFENCDAGLPTLLTKEILKNSYLDSLESRQAVLTYYRQEMADLDNQITAIILEAFPNLDIEEVEQWDVDKTCKYLSFAEWRLHHLRGIPFVETAKEPFLQQPQTTEVNSVEDIKNADKTKTERTLRGGDKKQKLTPEKLMEFKRKYPEIDWENDAVMQYGIEALEMNVDTTPPALRPLE